MTFPPDFLNLLVANPAPPILGDYTHIFSRIEFFKKEAKQQLKDAMDYIEEAIDPY